MLALFNGEVIILGGSKESETKWGARADGGQAARRGLTYWGILPGTI